MNSSDSDKRQFNLVWARDIKDTPEEIPFIVDNLFSEGSLNVLFGAPASKKSLSTIDLAVCVASGKDWLGFRVAKPYPVLIVDEESGEPYLPMRIIQTARGHGVDLASLSLCYVSFNALNLRKESEGVALNNLVKETGARLIIVDSMIDVVPGANENSSEDMSLPLRRLHAIVKESRAAAVVIHHENKSGGYRGSSAIKAAADVSISCKSREGSNYVRFKSDKVRYIPSFQFAAETHFDSDPINGNEFYLSPAESIAETRNDSQQFILDFLKEHGESKSTDIQRAAEESGICSASRIRGALSALKDDNVIVCPYGEGGRGRKSAIYRLKDSLAKNAASNNGRVKDTAMLD